MSRRIYDRREGRKSTRWIDRTGMIAHRLLYLEWLGKWHGRHFWKAMCDCGRTCEVIWSPANHKSCGCLKEETDRNRSFETQRTDGRWGLKNKLRLVMPDGRVTSVSELAHEVGVTRRVMDKRIKRWPPELWLTPPQTRGRRKAVIVKTEWHNKTGGRGLKRPYALANLKLTAKA